MGRLPLILGVLAALAFGAPGTAPAQERTLWPGVSYETGVQFTPHGPVAINVITGPRPGGTTTLAPVLSNDTVVDREPLTTMQRRLVATATTAGVNGDLFALGTGRPSGILMRDGALLNPPAATRASAGVLSDGTLEVRKVALQSTWQGAGAAHAIARLNAVARPGGVALFTTAYGAATPPLPGSTAAVLFPFPLPAPGIDLPATVAEVAPAGSGVAIPPGGAVLLGRGVGAEALVAEATPGATLTVRLGLKPDWPGLAQAIGGGPQIVRDAVPVFRAGETFTAGQLSPRAPRSAVGQLADGRIVLVAVDGRQPGYSVGLTNFELAQALVRLGAVTAMALDGGGSTTMAFDGTLLNRPSGGHERAIASALLFMYTGVFVAPPLEVVSPDGDGVADTQRLAYRLVRPSTATVTLTAPDGALAFSEAVERLPGSYPVAFPPAGAAAPPSDGRWTLAVDATDDLGQVSSMAQTFAVNSTLGFLTTERPILFLPPGGRDLAISWRLGREARVVVTVETSAGVVVRTLARRSYPAGEASVTWDGLGRDGKGVKGGRYVVRVVATNELGRTEQTRPLRVRRIAG